MKVIFWISLFVVWYTFLGYGLLLYLLVKIKRWKNGRTVLPEAGSYTPTLTVVIAAYNEADIIEQKIQNTLALYYPSHKLQLIIVTDGSSDDTPGIVARYPRIQLLHQPQRHGKIAAVHRAMAHVQSDITLFTDANTFLNKEALLQLCRHYRDKRVGAVSGEKRVHSGDASDATAGEGLYWKYESTLKRWDADLYSIVGAAGELFSIRTALYQPVPEDTILDDFMISLQVAAKGYRIAYEPAAAATESGSESIAEELKRKIRISAGGIQSILRMKQLMNPFHHALLSFQYISHRVLRWTITPFLLVLSFLLNGIIAWQQQDVFYGTIFLLQTLFYTMALLGWLMEKKQVSIKLLFIPFYFCMMNYAVIAGICRYLQKKQGAAWEKAKRRAATASA